MQMLDNLKGDIDLLIQPSNDVHLTDIAYLVE
jgi:hypothetical protein